jgi:hypothetical protein
MAQPPRSQTTRQARGARKGGWTLPPPLRESFVFALKRRAADVRPPWLSSHKLGRPVGLAAPRAGSPPHAPLLRHTLGCLVPHALLWRRALLMGALLGAFHFPTRTSAFIPPRHDIIAPSSPPCPRQHTRYPSAGDVGSGFHPA